MNAASLPPEALAVLRFYRDAGLGSVETETPGALWSLPDAAPAEPPARPPAKAGPSRAAPGKVAPGASVTTDEALAEAERAAASCSTLDELVLAIAAFEGCPLRESARGPVIHDGVLGAPVLVLGEAPGREEDRQGKPFVGRSGQLLDRMLAAIGLSRRPEGDEIPVCISNAIYWRPPGNRNPSKAEIAVCLPFVKRFIALSRPAFVLMTGNVPTQALFPDAPGITRSRGQLRMIEMDGAEPVPAMPIFHPAFLLRQPAQKKWAWRDLCAAQSKLKEKLS